MTAPGSPISPLEREPEVAYELVELQGHIVDSLTLAKVLDVVVAAGADYELIEVEVGRTNLDTSRARLKISATDEETLHGLLVELRNYGVNPIEHREARLQASPADGVLPEDFYSTTNLPTEVLLEGRWHSVAYPEMDCALVVGDGPVLRAIPMHRVSAGDAIVVGTDGVRVAPPPRRSIANSFEFMGSEVSSEKPKALIVAKVAERIRSLKGDGRRVLFVCGPAVVHTGAGPEVARLIREGWVDVLFSGNGFATHDLESNVLGTSLGVSMRAGSPTEGGHANHLRVINEVRRFGSIAAAIEAGYVSSGVMYEAARAGIPLVLAGSLRDDGPLPGVYSDVLQAADAMRSCIADVGIALMLASTLHAIATGNLLAASVETYCVDINQAVATKLSDRGSHQAVGIVTDVGLFLRSLSDELHASRP